MEDLRFIDLKAAREITGHRTDDGFRKYVRTWNQKRPDCPILRRRGGFVERGSLLAALREDSRPAGAEAA